mmetsp:Transcript_17748/g.51633  ORF Transcript_17748/g.51633 Transcript_17748/m.51633 type:complete len:209 (+) Transcript_17748:2104-2730(+)
MAPHALYARRGLRMCVLSVSMRRGRASCASTSSATSKEDTESIQRSEQACTAASRWSPPSSWSECTTGGTPPAWCITGAFSRSSVLRSALSMMSAWDWRSTCCGKETMTLTMSVGRPPRPDSSERARANARALANWRLSSISALAARSSASRPSRTALAAVLRPLSCWYSGTKASACSLCSSSLRLRSRLSAPDFSSRLIASLSSSRV